MCLPSVTTLCGRGSFVVLVVLVVVVHRKVKDPWPSVSKFQGLKSPNRRFWTTQNSLVDRSWGSEFVTCSVRNLWNRILVDKVRLANSSAAELSKTRMFNRFLPFLKWRQLRWSILKPYNISTPRSSIYNNLWPRKASANPPTSLALQFNQIFFLLLFNDTQNIILLNVVFKHFFPYSSTIKGWFLSRFSSSPHVCRQENRRLIVASLSAQDEKIIKHWHFS